MYSKGQKPRQSLWRVFLEFLLVLTLIFCVLLFILWRIDGPRAERFRLSIQETIFPSTELLLAPLTRINGLVSNLRSYEALDRENQALRREILKLESWKEAALQLEQINAELRALNNLSVSPSYSYVSTEIIADSGSPYSQSVLLNIGRNRGVNVGVAAVDGIGLLGRVIAVGEDHARVLLLSDPTSQISALIMPERQHAIVRGNNQSELTLIPIETDTPIKAGSRVVTSGDASLQADLLIGHVLINEAGEPSLRPAANLGQIGLTRILLEQEKPNLNPPDQLILPVAPLSSATPNLDNEGDADE